VLGIGFVPHKLSASEDHGQVGNNTDDNLWGCAHGRLAWYPVSELIAGFESARGDRGQESVDGTGFVKGGERVEHLERESWSGLD
jgi:hypothetical protein